MDSNIEIIEIVKDLQIKLEMIDKKLITTEETLKEINNGIIDTDNNVFKLKGILAGLIEIQKKLVHEKLGVSVPAPSTEFSNPAEKKNTTIFIEIENDVISISGNTYNYNTSIKEAAVENNTKAKWESSQKKWCMNKDCLKSLIKNLEALNLKDGVDFLIKEEKVSGFGIL